MKPRKRLLISFLVAAISLTGLVGVSYGSWNAGSESTNDNANSANQTFTSSTKDAICVNETTGKFYSSLPKAITDANSAATSSTKQTVTVLPGKTITISTTNIVLNSYVTLNLPFIQENGTYICDQTDTSKIGTYGGGRISQLNMRSGCDITIASNAVLNIGGNFTTTGNNGKYCEVNLGANSSITVNGTLDRKSVV